MRRIIVAVFIVFLVGFILWIINGYRIRAQQATRGKAISQFAGALGAYLSEDDVRAENLPTMLTKRFGQDILVRYAVITATTNPTASDMILIERPEQIEGEWCFAVFGDLHVAKVQRQKADEIIRAANSKFTAPTPSP